MAIGFEGAVGNEGLFATIRQQIADRMAQQAQTHAMSVEDQKLQIEKDRYQQEASDRALLRQQQGAAFNEKQAEGTAANLGPGQTVISPELASRFQNTTLAPLVKTDQTLPSTQIAAGASLPGSDGSQTAPAVKEQPSVLTGQMRFMGTPAANAAENTRVLRGQLLGDPSLTSQQRMEMQAESVGLKAPTREPAGKPGVIHDTANGLVRIGDDNSVTPVLGPSGKPVQGYHPPPSANPNDASAIADAIESGIQPPDTKGLFRLAGPVRAELANRGYDLRTANLDWQATQKHLATLNGTQQTRLRQAISTASDSLDVIQQLTDAWDGGRFPILNRANLGIAKNGGYGKEAASIATQLEGQITDVVSELGNIYMGGNSPTDQALVLAQKNLSADWDRKVLTDMIGLARKNIQIRNNSIKNTDAITASSQAAPAPTGPQGATQPPVTPPTVEQWTRDANGKLVRQK